MDKLDLLLAVHCHQPVGNFGMVFSKAYEEAYLPFIKLLEQYPNIKISLHYSGSLLDWLEITHPEFLKRIKGLVRKGQVEIFAGGYYEPILTLIPQNDALFQIEMLKNRIKELFAFQARGCWLSERVWEPRLASILDKSGLNWTVVDDSHFRSAGFAPKDLSGYYITEDEGRPFAIFPASEKLRYLMPFKLPQETIDYLRNLYEQRKIRCICFADDGEKFGLWPGTNRWVYKEGWLEKFFKALKENDSWLRVKAFSQYFNEYPPAGRIYLSCASYREMMEWSGGYFRNFFLKYHEANWMHKRMLCVSQKLNNLVDRSSVELSLNKKTKAVKKLKGYKLKKAARHLYMAQANDSYWHGVFGGLYLNHLRSAVYYHLIEAEKIINAELGHRLETEDVDYDGQDEIVLSSNRLSCIFAPQRGGALLELDYKPKSINLINTLMRRKETYHQKIKQNTTDSKNSSNQPHSIHDFSRLKRAGLGDVLLYDLFPRYCCLDHFLDKKTSLAEFFGCKYKELGDSIQAPYRVDSKKKDKNKIYLVLSRQGKILNSPIDVVKGVILNDNELVINYTVRNKSTRNLNNLFGIEFNLSVYDNNLSKASGEIKGDSLKINDIWNNISLEFAFTSTTRVFHFPVETIFGSETGIERTYQELCLLFGWQIDIAPRDEWTTRLGLKIWE